MQEQKYILDEKASAIIFDEAPEIGQQISVQYDAEPGMVAQPECVLDLKQSRRPRQYKDRYKGHVGELANKKKTNRNKEKAAKKSRKVNR